MYRNPLLENSNDTPAKLRKNVTSPKGTTEAALKVLMKKNGQNILLLLFCLNASMVA